MKQNNSTKAIVESGILTAIAVILVLLSFYVPLFSIVGLFLWPIPITLIYVKHGFKYSLLALIVTGLLAAITSDPISALGIVLDYGFLSLVLGYCIVNKKSSGYTIAAMSTIAFASLILVIKLTGLLMGQDLIDELIKQSSTSFDIAKSLYTKLGLSKDQLAALSKNMLSPQLLRMIVPTILLASAVFMSFITYAITRKIFKRFGYDIPKIKPFSEWYMPTGLAMGIIGLVFLGYGAYYFKVTNGELFFSNTNLLFQLAFLINGYSVFDFYLKKWNIAKVIRILIILFAISPPFSYLALYVGIFEYAFNFRKLDQNRRSFRR